MYYENIINGNINKNENIINENIINVGARYMFKEKLYNKKLKWTEADPNYQKQEPD